ncbi:hypothetical protein ACFU53_30465 [Streptomyces sp. NPDC057474]|uniref:hypothetical protein n=1 Tax=Streptomyces sp. NPDC057474 TaxID=3346144 RepID=UPI0036759ACF
MNQRKDNYRAALRRGKADPGPHTRKATTLRNGYVRVTIEVDPDVQRILDRWMVPAVSVLTNTCAAALRVLTAFVAKTLT